MNIFLNLFQKETPHSEIAIIYRNNSSADGMKQI